MNAKKVIEKIVPSVRYGKTNIKELYTIGNYVKSRLNEIDEKNEFLFWLSNNRNGETLEETKKRVFQSIPKATGLLRDIQLSENYILKSVKQICDENGLRFFLMGGTLLGAYRHKGFIPWDDDIDIGMMDSDCVKLKKIIDSNKSQLEMKLFYQLRGGSLYKVKIKGFNSPFIDIFPFQYLNCLEEETDKCWKETSIITEKMSTFIKDYLKNNHNDMVEHGHSIRIDRMDEIVETEYQKSILNCKYIETSGKYFAESIMNGSDFRNSRNMLKCEESFPLLADELEFEGRKYDVWKDYQNRLTYLYGDYLSFPSSMKYKHSLELRDIDVCIKYLKDRGMI